MVQDGSPVVFGVGLADEWAAHSDLDPSVRQRRLEGSELLHREVSAHNPRKLDFRQGPVAEPVNNHILPVETGKQKG